MKNANPNNSKFFAHSVTLAALTLATLFDPTTRIFTISGAFTYGIWGG